MPLVVAALIFSLMSTWAHYTFVPALAGVLAAEAFAIRSVLFHAGNGAVCALIGWSLTGDLRDQQFLSKPTVLVAAGIAAGFVYWLIAGWTAGFWKPLSWLIWAPLKISAREWLLYRLNVSEAATLVRTSCDLTPALPQPLTRFLSTITVGW